MLIEVNMNLNCINVSYGELLWSLHNLVFE